MSWESGESGSPAVITRRVLLQAILAQVVARQASAQARVHGKPKPLATDAVTHDWTSFLGPAHNATSPRDAPQPDAASAARVGVSQGHELYVAGRRRRSAAVRPPRRRRRDRRMPARGDRRAAVELPLRHGLRRSLRLQQRPAVAVRSSTAIACTPSALRDSSIAWMLRSGKVMWRRHIATEYKVPQDFFGTASTPLVEDKLLIVNVGAPGGPCVVALDKMTGREVWRAGKEWGPSYASPVPAVVHGKRRIFVFAGGESTPPSGGLLSIDPSNGRVDFTFPVAQPLVRVGERVVSRRLRQQGVHLGELSNRRRVTGNQA